MSAAGKNMKKAPIVYEYFKTRVPLECAFYRPMQLITHAYNEDSEAEDYEYWALDSSDTPKLGCKFARKCENFDVSNLEAVVFNRFVGLLAPMTLYQLSKASKQVYFACLELRGLEYCGMRSMPGHENVGVYRRETQVSEYEGKRVGGWLEPRLTPYSINFGHFTTSLFMFVNYPEIAGFVKKYKSIEAYLEEEYFDDHAVEFFDTFFHPEIEHVYVDILSKSEHFPLPRKTVSLAKFRQMLGYCKTVKTLKVAIYLRFFPDPTDADFNIVMTEDPDMASVLKAVELFAAEAQRLELLFFTYKGYLFWMEMETKKLKQCVKFQYEWYFLEEIQLQPELQFGYKILSELFPVVIAPTRRQYDKNIQRLKKCNKIE